MVEPFSSLNLLFEQSTGCQDLSPALPGCGIGRVRVIREADQLGLNLSTLRFGAGGLFLREGSVFWSLLLTERLVSLLY